MLQVDFYLLPDSEATAREHFACRLAEKAWRSGLQVYLRAASAEAAQALDGLLWAFRRSSFVPHALHSEGNAPGAPVLVGQHEAGVPADRQVLINLAPGVPPHAAGIERIAEVVIRNTAAEAAARQQWRLYRDAGVEPRKQDMRQG